MATEESPDSGHFVPEVIDRIAEAARQVGTHDVEPLGETSSGGAISVEKVSADGSITVTLSDGRLTGLSFDEATGRRRVSTVVDGLIALINDALLAHDEAVLAELQANRTDFGALLGSLEQLQSDLHSAYITDIQRLNG